MLNNINLSQEECLITSESQMTDIFYNGQKDAKTLAQKLVGVEFEKLPVSLKNYSSVNYKDVARLLLMYKPENSLSVKENDSILGLNIQEGTLTLEPGAQTEISLKPLPEISRVESILKCYNKTTAKLADSLGFCWLGYGIQPVSVYKDINIIPKKRYECMTKYLPTVAKKPLVMMRETSGIQASFDYKSESDAMRKFRFALKLSPIVSAMYSNSPVRQGKLTKYKSNRSASWLDTDSVRCGLVSEKIFNKDFSFSDYVDVLSDVPMIFIERTINGQKKVFQTGKLTFRQFYQSGFMGFRATTADWENHLSLYFSDVRLKSYIEIRNHDNQRQNLSCSVPALWKGRIYNDDAMDYIESLLKKLSYFDYEYLRHKTPQTGIDIEIKGLNLQNIAKEIVETSYFSLKENGNDEEKYLEPLLSLVQKSKTPADLIIDLWQNEWNKDVSKLVQYSKLV